MKNLRSVLKWSSLCFFVYQIYVFIDFAFFDREISDLSLGCYILLTVLLFLNSFLTLRDEEREDC